jgi:hypothetical protein
MKQLMYVANGNTYQMVFPDKDLETIGNSYRSTGNTGGWRPPQQAASSVQKGWVNGVDSRFRWPYGSGDWPRDTMGALVAYDKSQCSGTLFSSQLVVTAAHCISSFDGSWNLPDSFVPGMDGTYDAPPDIWEYGSPAVVNFAYFNGWTANGCNLNNAATPPCQIYDIAVLMLGDNVGYNTGWMGWYWATADSTVAGWGQFNFGYPDCPQPGAPAGCADSTMWGDLFTCSIGAFFNPGSDGVHQNYLFGCDFSAGDSGSALWSFSPSGCSSVPCIAGIGIDQNCLGASCAGNFTPNVAFRIDQNTSNAMAYMQSLFP